MHATPIAILGDLSFGELLVVALASVLIFGRRLPQVAARGFAEFQRLRRALTDTWRDTGIEDELRRVQRDLERSLPRDFDPARIARRETREIERRLRSDGQLRPRLEAGATPADAASEPAAPVADPEPPSPPPREPGPGDHAEGPLPPPPPEE